MKQFEESFDDKSTAFIFTSDHGMTNRGSHGSGHHHETQTPFLAWGAGVNYWLPANDDFVTRNYITIDGQEIPRFDIQQADVAPLISTLLGIPVPTNNFGKLPYMYPNVSKEYLANAFANNAYQLHAMYTHLHQQSLQRAFHFSFNLKERKIEEEIAFLDEQIRLSFTLKDFDDIIVKSNKMITAIHGGIEFYQMYYKYELLIALTIAMIGWILLLYQYLATSKITFKMKPKILAIGGIVSLIIIAYNLLQKAPLIVLGYFLLPVIVWMVLLSNNGSAILSNVVNTPSHLLISMTCIAVTELMVFSFFQRKILSLILLGYSGAITVYAIRRKLQPKLKILKYFSSAVCLSFFPLLKVIDKDTKDSRLL